MNKLIPINTDAETMTVNGRDLHMFLEVETPYRIWFPRMCEYGFEEGRDFNPYKNVRVQIEGNREISREITDHQMTIDMAKEIAMLQRNEKGKQARQYFLEIEKEWNSPEKVMARALVMANKKISMLEISNKEQKEQIAIKDQMIGEMKPKADYVDRILSNPQLMPVTLIAKDYGMSGKKFNKVLNELKVQYKIGKQWVLYSQYQAGGYTSSKQYPDITHSDGSPITNLEWTQKGRLFLYEFLKKKGILPMIEREGA